MPDIVALFKKKKYQQLKKQTIRDLKTTQKSLALVVQGTK